MARCHRLLLTCGCSGTMDNPIENMAHSVKNLWRFLINFVNGYFWPSLHVCYEQLYYSQVQSSKHRREHVHLSNNLDFGSNMLEHGMVCLCAKAP